MKRSYRKCLPLCAERDDRRPGARRRSTASTTRGADPSFAIVSSPHETCSRTSTSHCGASTITSWPQLVGSNVRQLLSALHSANAERRLRIGGGADVGLLRDLLARACELDRLQRHAVGLRRGLGIDRGAVLLVDRESFRLWGGTAGLALLHRRQQSFAAELGRHVEQTLAILRLERIEPDD